MTPRWSQLDCQCPKCGNRLEARFYDIGTPGAFAVEVQCDQCFAGWDKSIRLHEMDESE